MVRYAGQDQTLFLRFVKGLAAQCSHEAALASDVLPFLTAAFENAAVTGCLLAKSRQVWPSRAYSDFSRGKK
jgi:hypothetical protein